MDEKAALGDAFIHVDKLISEDYVKTISPHPTLELLLEKFISFLQLAVEDEFNKPTIITLL